MDPTLTRNDMRYWLIKPDPRLRSWVHCYFVVEPGAGAQRGSVYRQHKPELLLPDGHSELIFNLEGDGYERWAVSGDAQPTLMRRSYLIGGRSHSVMTRNIREVRLAGVKLDPRALHALIGVPLTEFEDATLSLIDLNQPALLQLEESLACAGSVLEMKRLLNQFFLRALTGLSPAHAATHKLLHDLHGTRGALSIMEWSRTHEVDARNLERRFNAAVGMTPKRYARVIRFKHSYHQLISGAARTAASPHLDGFYDQSHFNREFKFFTGVAPSTKLSGQMSSGMSISDHLLEGELG